MTSQEKLSHAREHFVMLRKEKSPPVPKRPRDTLRAMTWPRSARPPATHTAERRKISSQDTKWEPSLPSTDQNAQAKKDRCSIKLTKASQLTGLLSRGRITRTLATTLGSKSGNRRDHITGRRRCHRLSRSISSWQVWCQSRRSLVEAGKAARHIQKPGEGSLEWKSAIFSVYCCIWDIVLWITWLDWFVRKQFLVY